MTEYSDDIRERINQLKAEYDTAFAASGATLPPLEVTESGAESACTWFFEHATAAYEHALQEVHAGHTLTADWYSLQGAAYTLAGDACMAVSH